MSQAIKQRMLELGLSPVEFSRRAKVTLQGLAPVRKGRRRNYETQTIVGVARGLQWPLDWYDRLQAGEDSSGFPNTEHSEVARSVEDRITALEADVRQLVADVRSLLPGGGDR